MSNQNPNLTPSATDDMTLIAGGVDFLKSTLPLILVIRQMLMDKDIGEIVADTLIDSTKRVNSANILLAITFYSNQKPPFTRKGYKRAVYKISDLKRSNLKWGIIKAACGGDNGYMGGRFRATANLSTGRQMQVFGATEQEAISRLKALQSLSNSKITTLTCSEMKTDEGYGAKGDILYKETVRMYPAFCTIINTEKINDEQRREQKEATQINSKMKSTTQGLFARKTTRKIPLWVETEPDWFNAEVAEQFINRGINNNTQS